MTVDGNRLTVLPDGPGRLDALIALIDGAKQSLRLLYYMYLSDKSGERVRDAIMAAIDRGVDVSLLPNPSISKDTSTPRSTAAMIASRTRSPDLSPRYM